MHLCTHIRTNMHHLAAITVIIRLVRVQNRRKQKTASTLLVHARTHSTCMHGLTRTKLCIHLLKYVHTHTHAKPHMNDCARTLYSCANIHTCTAYETDSSAIEAREAWCMHLRVLDVYVTHSLVSTHKASGLMVVSEQGLENANVLAQIRLSQQLENQAKPRCSG